MDRAQVTSSCRWIGDCQKGVDCRDLFAVGGAIKLWGGHGGRQLELSFGPPTRPWPQLVSLSRRSQWRGD